MTTSKYFNRVMALDSPHIGHVVRETEDKIVVFGGGKIRYDISVNEIQTTGRNVLIGLTLNEIQSKYKVDRETSLPTRKNTPYILPDDRLDLATYEGKYPKSLFNKGVRAKNEDHVGHIMVEAHDKIVVFDDRNHRYDIPKSEIIAVGMNTILGIDFPEIYKYEVDKNAQLPIEKLI
jgi:hypothetical protein